ncbi:MAG: Hsp70 family protein [Roseburia sp.]
MEEQNAEMTLPHNLPNGEKYIKRFRKLINTAMELGGTVYDVAADSGLLSAHHFLELALDEQVQEEKILSEDMLVVTEVYVRYPDMDELERIFLYSDDAARDSRLVREGKIEGGKLIINYEDLKYLHERGYLCFYQRAEDAGKGLSSNRFRDVFGSQQKRIPFQMWDEDYEHFVGNGFNQALLVRTNFETVLVMPDVYAVQQSIKVFHAENLIRQEYDANFSIERIQLDGKVTGELENIRMALFGRAKMKEYENFRNAYRKLTCQIAYIKVYYKKIYETVWEDDEFAADDEKTYCNFDLIEDVTMGISLSGYEGCFAVCRMPDGSIKRVPDMDCPYDIPLAQKYEFKGYGNIKDAGVAGSRMALIMKRMIRSAEFMLDVCVKRVVVTHIGELPTNEQILQLMEKRRKRHEKRNEEALSLDLLAFEEMGNTEMDGLGVIKWAAEQAKIPQMEYVDSLHAVLTAFEKSEVVNELKPQDIALIYDFRPSALLLTLVRKEENATLSVIAEKEKWGPEYEMYEENELDEGAFNPNLEYVLANSMEDFMMDAGLRALGIYGEKEMDKEAFSELRGSAPRVQRQFKRNDEAKVFFNNGYLSMMENYPIEKFKTCFEPILKANEAFLCEFIAEAGISKEDIAKVYLLGSDCEYPFVRKSVESVLQKKTCCVYPCECVAARGAAFFEANAKQ